MRRSISIGMEERIVKVAMAVDGFHCRLIAGRVADD
jgi:hypothetical protein